MTEKMALVPQEHEMTVYDTIANRAVKSKFYKSLGDSSAVMTMMLSARELGISPMAAINGGLNIIQGKVEISARMMNAMIRRAGHSIKTLESTETICKLRGKRADNGDTEDVSFSMDDAKRASLVRSGGGWGKYPSDMLYARALSRLARRLFPDVIGCAYVEGEIRDADPPRDVEEIQEADIVVESTNEIQYLIDKVDKDQQLHLQEYIKQVHDKFDIDYVSIIKKYDEDPKSFMEKFQVWKTKHSAFST